MSNDTTCSTHSSISTSIEDSESSSSISTDKLLPQRNANDLDTSTTSSSSSSSSSNSASSSSSSKSSFELSKLQSQVESSKRVNSTLHASHSHQSDLELRIGRKEGLSSQEAMIEKVGEGSGAQVDLSSGGHTTHGPLIVQQHSSSFHCEQEEERKSGGDDDDTSSRHSEVPPQQKHHLDDLSGLPLTPIPLVPQPAKAKRRKAQQQEEEEGREGKAKGKENYQRLDGADEQDPFERGLLEEDTPPPRLPIAIGRQRPSCTSGATPKGSVSVGQSGTREHCSVLNSPPRTEREMALHNVASQAVELSEQLARALCDAKREVERLKGITDTCRQCRTKVRQDVSSRPKKEGGAIPRTTSVPPTELLRPSRRTQNPNPAAPPCHKARKEKTTTRGASMPCATNTVTKPTVERRKAAPPMPSAAAYHPNDHHIHYVVGASDTSGVATCRSRDRQGVRRHGLWRDPVPKCKGSVIPTPAVQPETQEEGPHSMNYYAWRTCHQALDELQRLLLAEEELSIIKKHEGKSQKQEV